jgi:electron transport complex protein RnfD
MDKLKLMKTYAPHWRDTVNIHRIMVLMIVSLIPTIFAAVMIFGWNAVLILLVSTGVAWLTDISMQKVYRTRKFMIVNPSAIITGLLVGLILPARVPLWMPGISSFIAVALAKYPFGQGNSIFNPALIGRTFLFISWPTILAKSYLAPDGITGATPLTILKSKGIEAVFTTYETKISFYLASILGQIGGCIGETSAIAIIIGGVFLIWLKVIDWKIPVIYISTVFFLALVSGQNALFHLITGGLLFGAFFMATDYVTNPTSIRGKIIFALGCGILTFVFRLFAAHPEGVAFSILIMNAFTPLIDRLTIPKPFGGGSR